MNWEKITSVQFERAVDDCGRVCLLPIGVVEKHGDHLPLGQDTIYIHDVCSRAADEEPAIVFPAFFFGQILEAKHVPGTVALGRELLVPLLEKVCDEIGRNGLQRIIVVNGHGGNNGFLRYFLALLLERQKPYTVYMSGAGFSRPDVSAVAEATVDGHAGERETCSMLFLHPELVRVDAFGDYGTPLRRLQEIREAGLNTPVDWYADFPGHFAGDRVALTAEKGRSFVAADVAHLVEQIRVVKSDLTTPALYQEFFRRHEKPENRYL